MPGKRNVPGKASTLTWVRARAFSCPVAAPTIPELPAETRPRYIAIKNFRGVAQNGATEIHYQYLKGQVIDNQIPDSLLGQWLRNERIRPATAAELAA